jgi:hypothetical protein
VENTKVEKLLLDACDSEEEFAFYAKKENVIGICAYFFAQPILPNEDCLQKDTYPSMAGAMVHEFTHASVGTKDNAYSCTAKNVQRDPNGGRPVIKRGAGHPDNRASKLPLLNADSYRCWVEESAIGYGNNTPKIRQ